jgi:hypothetical protein
MTDKDIVSSPNAVAMNVACPICQASPAQYCFKGNREGGGWWPLGEVHLARQQAFLDRHEKEKM